MRHTGEHLDIDVRDTGSLQVRCNLVRCVGKLVSIAHPELRCGKVGGPVASADVGIGNERVVSWELLVALRCRVGLLQ